MRRTGRAHSAAPLVSTSDPERGEEHLRFWMSRLRKPYFVYVIQGEPGSPIKVGRGKDAKDRIAQHQCSTWQTLRLLHILPGDPELEWQLHKKLHDVRIKGEWFKPTVGFLEFVAKLADQLVDAYDGSGVAPHWREFGHWKKRRTASEPGEVTVRFVEPEPRIDPEEAKRMRESVRGLSRGVYLGPAHPASRDRISRHPGWNIV